MSSKVGVQLACQCKKISWGKGHMSLEQGTMEFGHYVMWVWSFCIHGHWSLIDTSDQLVMNGSLKGLFVQLFHHGD